MLKIHQDLVALNPDSEITFTLQEQHPRLIQLCITHWAHTTHYA